MDPATIIVGAVVVWLLLRGRAPAAMPANGSRAVSDFDLIGTPLPAGGIGGEPGMFIPRPAFPAPAPPSDFMAHIEVCPPYCGGSEIPNVPFVPVGGTVISSPASPVSNYPTSDFLPEGPAGGSVLLSAADPRVIYRAGTGRG